MTTIVSKRQSDAVADKVLRRAELGKVRLFSLDSLSRFSGVLLSPIMTE